MNSESFLKEGEEYFMNNQPEEAAIFFETALEQDPANEKIYLYLGIIYEQLGKNDGAISILQKGLSKAVIYKDKFYFNIGNNLFTLNQNNQAKEMYSSAIKQNPRLTGAYLNRANTRIRLEEYTGAVKDYKIYLNLDSSSDQKAKIEEIIRLLEEMVKEQEIMKLAADEKRKAEEEHQKALLNSVLNSLENASEQTTNLSADTEEIEYQEEEIDIED